MAIDFEKVSKYLQEIGTVESILVDNQELFDDEKMIEFKQITNALKQNVDMARNESRQLSIGIVGAVKAGKSSFLNACIFNGEDYLPKAATPMTASLTKISYSDKPRAIIHFYTKEDWEIIEKQAKKYDLGLENAYQSYLDRFHRQSSQHEYYGSAMVQNKPITKEEFEKKRYNCKSEEQLGAKELTRMITDDVLLKKLGQEDIIDGDIMSNLNHYVGANGYYTPIVSHVELQVDNPNMKDLEIVDTPGLNDPVVSRGKCTKQFLRHCDVVLLLSPCSQFMDANTVQLMANRLPSEGVKEIMVIGSKLDSGILNEDANDFAGAYRKSSDSYKKQFLSNMTEAKKSNLHLEMLNKMVEKEALYISSASFSIWRKLKEGQELDGNEKIIYNNLHCFKDFNDKYLLSLSGIKKVQEALEEIKSRKAEIIDGKNSGLLENTRNNHLRILDKILQETVSSRTKLETISAEEMKLRTSIIKDTIDSSRVKLTHIFDGAIIKCDEKIQQILPQMAIEMSQHQKIAVKSFTEDKCKTIGVGLFGWKKEVIHYTVTNNTADVASVVQNIKQYGAKCHTFVNSEFNYIFNKDEFAQKIKSVMLAAFQKSGKDFEEDDILLPLQNVLSKISIPHIKFDFTKYIDDVETRFNCGYAKNEDIHKLNNLQSRLLNQIEEEIANQLLQALQEITKTLKNQAVTFADHIEKDFCAELEKLKKQVEERKYYIEQYLKFADNIRKIKIQLLL